ncbi:MAG: XshC-Cox1-family protein [Methylomonas sp.]|nr:MAG: XshC-Cox1-family protein [Methylomonas sp.]
MNTEFAELSAQFCRQRIAYAVATVVEISGSASAKPGAKALFNGSGQLIHGWVGGGCAQTMVARTALACLARQQPVMVEVDLDDEIFGAGMPCGGKMRVFVEPVLPEPKLWLMGNGLIAETLCLFARQLGFAVTVNDPQVLAEKFPGAEIISEDPHYQALQPEPADFLVIATHHKGDYLSLTRALQSNARYIALVASRKRAGLIKARLTREGVAAAALDRIRAPAGLDLGGITPQEIALSVISEMVLIRRGNGFSGLTGQGVRRADQETAKTDYLESL